MFDPDALPMPDLGLRCLGCGYPLAYLTTHVCPECGRAVVMDEHIPDGAFPLLIADGAYVRASADLHELMRAYHIPVVEQLDLLPSATGIPQILLSSQEDRGPCVTVSRDRYWQAVDLVRRWRLDEPLPPPPEPLPIDGPWVCASCGEENPETFELCWNCGTLWGGGDEGEPG